MARSLVPFDQLPSAEDPANGILATANSRVTPDGYPYQLTLELGRALSPTNASGNGWQVRTILKPAGHADDPANRSLLRPRSRTSRGAMPTRSTTRHGPISGCARRPTCCTLVGWRDEHQLCLGCRHYRRTQGFPGRCYSNPNSATIGSFYTWRRKILCRGRARHPFSRAMASPPRYANWNDFWPRPSARASMPNTHPQTSRPGNTAKFYTIGLEHPLYGNLPWFKKWTGTGVQPSYEDVTTVDQMGARLGPSQRLTVDWSNLDRSTGKHRLRANPATRSAPGKAATSGPTGMGARPSPYPLATRLSPTDQNNTACG